MAALRHALRIQVAAKEERSELGREQRRTGEEDDYRPGGRSERTFQVAQAGATHAGGRADGDQHVVQSDGGAARDDYGQVSRAIISSANRSRGKRRLRRGRTVVDGLRLRRQRRL